MTEFVFTNAQHCWKV